MSAKPVRDQFINYIEATGLQNAPEYQLREIQLGFYAGAKAMFKIMNGVADSIPDTDEGVKLGVLILTAINDDLNEFAREQLRQHVEKNNGN